MRLFDDGLRRRGLEKNITSALGAVQNLCTNGAKLWKHEPWEPLMSIVYSNLWCSANFIDTICGVFSAYDVESLLCSRNGAFSVVVSLER